MVIYYFGHSYFLIRGNDYSIALDPFSNVGLKETRVSADYVFCSHNHFDHNNESLVSGAKTVKNGQNFEIVKCYHDNEKGALRGENNVLIFKLDGKKFVFFGDEGENYNENLINKCKGVDVLFIPIGSVYTIDSKTALNYINEIKPKTVIPMHYKVKGSKIDINGIETFTKLISEYTEKNSPYTYNENDKIVILNALNVEVLK